MSTTLPDSTRLEYFAEGGANVVYTLRPDPPLPDSAPSDTDPYGPATPPPTKLEPWQTSLPQEDIINALQGKLLRLRKDLPTATPVRDAQHAFETRIAPLFSPHELVPQMLVRVPDATVERLAAELEAMEQRRDGLRPAKRHGTRLRREGYGVLIADMSLRPGRDVLVLELKPKWLAQSPSAPRGARRCRTCALRAMRASRTKAEDEGRGAPGVGVDGGFCPLDLVSGDGEKVSSLVRRLLAGQGVRGDVEAGLERRLAGFLSKSALLRKLRELQQTLDSVGVLAPTLDVERLTLAMTLRDCSLFLRVSNMGHFRVSGTDWAKIPIEGEIEARLGDLDPKSPTKIDHWKALEQQLIDSGWYTAADETGPITLPICALQRP